MQIVLALDFDGTLYKLGEHDSEEVLMSVVADTPDRITLMESTIRELRNGADPRVFEEVLRDMLIGAPLEAISKAVDIIMPTTSLEEMAVVKELAMRHEIHLHIVSCGTDMLISEFLNRVDILPYTEGIHAKELVHDERTFINFIWHITGPEDKRHTVETLKNAYPDSYLISVGDGFTDGPMLDASDLGLLIEWPGSKHHEMNAKRITSFVELKQLIDSIDM